MPGLSGIVTAGESMTDPQRVLDALSQVNSLKGLSFVEKSFISSHGVILNTLTGLLKNLEQPALEPAQNTLLFLEGEVFNTPDLLRSLKAAGGRSTCTTLLDLFLQEGPDFVTRVNGNFNILIYQKRERRLMILGDRYASKPLYYLEEAGRLLFGSEKKSVVRLASKTLAVDPVGLLQVFAHRHNLSGSTFIEGVKCLPPGSRLEYQAGKLELSTHSKLGFNVPGSLPRPAALMDEWQSLLKEATRIRLEGKERVVLSLSGGLDSRAVACAIPRHRRPVWARTRGFADSPDFLCGAEIARRLGFLHYREDPRAVDFSAIIPKIVWRTEGAVIYANCMTLTHHQVMKEQGDFILGGHFGDVISGAHIYPYMFLPRSRSQFIERAFRWYLVYPIDSLRRVFHDDFLRRSFPLLRDAFHASFLPLAGGSNIEAYQLWDLRERQARMTVCAAPVDSHLFEKVYVFLDNGCMDFALSLPTRLRFGQPLYQAVIYRLGPEIRDVPYANTGLRLRGSVVGNWRNTALSTSSKAGKKIAKIFSSSSHKAQERSTREGIREATRKEPAFRQVLEDFVRSSHFDGSVFDGKGILGLLDEHCRGAADHSHLLSILATMAMALRFFVYERPGACPSEAEPMEVPVPAGS